MMAPHMYEPHYNFAALADQVRRNPDTSFTCPSAFLREEKKLLGTGEECVCVEWGGGGGGGVL